MTLFPTSICSLGESNSRRIFLLLLHFPLLLLLLLLFRDTASKHYQLIGIPVHCEIDGRFEMLSIDLKTEDENISYNEH